MAEISEDVTLADQFTSQQKTKYFATLAAHTTSAFRQHVGEGLWVKNNMGERDWGNVSEHCLVEVARVGVLSDMVGLPGPIKKALEVAAGLHDVHKKQQKEIVTQHGLSFASFDLAAETSHAELTEAGFSENIVNIAGSVGHESLHNIEPILAKDELTDLDKARLIMHYADDYTINENWVHPVEEKDGKRFNDLDRRMDANEANERYAVLNQEGKAHFNGETAYEAQRRVGHDVERRLTQLIQGATGEIVDPLDLPTLVDVEIKTRIAKE